MLRELICFVGLCLCGYLLYLTEYVGLCLGHCDPLNYSLGIAWFLTGIVVRSRKVLKVWAVIGLIGITYFVIREFFEGFCFYCTVIHLIGIASILSLKTGLK